MKLPSVSSSALLQRNRLIEKLNLSTRYRTTIVRAPHGFGKSIAVSQFITNQGFSYAYTQFVEEDDHPKPFFTCLKRMILALLDSTVKTEGPPDVLISEYIGLLSESNEDRYLIFDNVEVLHHKHIAAWFSFLIEYLPDTVHLILIGTEISVLPRVSKSNESVLNISRNVLALTEDEANQLAECNTVMIAPEALTLLLYRTWGSPLFVAACFAQVAQRKRITCEQIEAQLTSLEDFFTAIWEEIPRKAEPALFLIALLQPFVCSPILEDNRLATNTKIETGIRTLADKSLFVEIDKDNIVSVLPLFRSFVIKQLKTAKKAYTEIAVDQALSYLLESKSYRKAIQMGLEIEDYTLATDLLDEYSSRILSAGYVDFITSVIEQIPRQYIERYASLLLLEIISGIRKGWTAQQVLDRVARIHSSRLRKKMQEIDLLSILDGIDLLFQRDFYRAEKLMNKLPYELSYLRPLLSVFLSSLPFGCEEDLAQVYHHLQETLRTIGTKQDDALSIVFLGQIGMIQLELLLFEQAKESFHEALRLGYDEKRGYATSCSLACVGIGLLCLYSGENDEAEAHMLQGLNLGKGYSFYLSLHAQMALAEYYIVTNRHEEAVRLLRDAGKQAKEYDVTSIDDRIIEAMHALSMRRIQDLPGLEMWVRKGSQREATQCIPFYLYELEQRQVLGYYQMTGQTEQANALYTSLQALLKKHHRLLHSLILDIEYGVFDPKQAVFPNAQINEYHLSTLVELYGPQPVSIKHTLTQRELEVLQMIGEGFLNKEIAQKLHITERTVKWHASQIYEKLQVSSRMEAVSEARKMGIL